MAKLFDRAAVIGVGLIGGSLAMAARRAELIGHVVGVGRGAENLRTARERGIVDSTTQDLAEIGPVDLVVLAVPVRTTDVVARALAPHLRAGTVVTDVGSVKQSVVSGAEEALHPDCFFVGGHPIAGGDRTGAGAADPDLFQGARCVLTPTPRTEPRALSQVEALWRGVGAEVRKMDPADHDRALAWTSHLVHVLAYALVRAIESTDPTLFDFAGPSLREATRVAASAPELWRDIFLANASPLDEVIGRFLDQLGELRGAVGDGAETDLLRFLEESRAARVRFEGPRT